MGLEWGVEIDCTRTLGVTGICFSLGVLLHKNVPLSELIESVHLKYMHFIVGKLYLTVD